MNGPSHPDDFSPDRPRSSLDGLDPRLLMAEGLWFALEEEGPGARPEIPGYEILSLLGAGGMGQVWLARQASLDRLVAVKVLATSGPAATQWLERLEREARAMAKLPHPNIVAVYDFVRLGDGGAAIVMEWLGSGNLRENRLAPGKPVRDLGTVLSIVRQIAAGLAAAHGAGIVHRDLKPENVLVAADGSVKVSDFGLALPMGPDSQRLTLTGASVGTVGYTAPEQLEGREVDGRADVYSLGVILYELLTGQRPQGNFDPPGRIRRDLPSGLQRLILDSLRTQPQKRPASIAEFLSRLSRSGRSRVPAPVLVLVGLAAIALAGTVAWQATHQPEDAAAPESGEAAPPPARESPPPVAGRLRPAGSALPAGLTVPDGWESRVEIKPLRGEWTADQDGFRSDGDRAVLQLLNSVPRGGFRVRVSFTRLEGDHSVAIFFRSEQGVATADVSAWERSLAGIQYLDGLDLRALENPPVFPIENGRRYEMVLELGPETARLSIDGTVLQEVPIAGRALGVTFPWEWETLDHSRTWLAIGSYESPTWFHSVEITELPP